MKKANQIQLKEEKDLQELSNTIKKCIQEYNWEMCEHLIPQYMELYPHSAVPHNLMGIMLEKQRKHVDAMRHFRAAAALDASYQAANFNMQLFAAFDRAWDVEPAF